MFPESRYSASGFISAPCQAQASRTRNRPQPRYCGQVRLPTASACRVVMGHSRCRVGTGLEVGAGLLAKAVNQSPDALNDTPYSRASPLPHRARFLQGLAVGCSLLVQLADALLQLGQVGVDVRQLLGLVSGFEVVVSADGGALLEQLQLADRQQLVIARRQELAQLHVLQHGLLFIGVAVVGEEI